MKQRLLTGWSVRRVVYLLGGIGMTIYFLMNNMWLMSVPCLYFVAMGIFAFGCADGKCAVNSSGKISEI